MNTSRILLELAYRHAQSDGWKAVHTSYETAWWRLLSEYWDTNEVQDGYLTDGKLQDGKRRHYQRTARKLCSDIN